MHFSVFNLVTPLGTKLHEEKKLPTNFQRVGAHVVRYAFTAFSHVTLLSIFSYVYIRYYIKRGNGYYQFFFLFLFNWLLACFYSFVTLTRRQRVLKCNRSGFPLTRRRIILLRVRFREKQRSRCSFTPETTRKKSSYYII